MAMNIDLKAVYLCSMALFLFSAKGDAAPLAKIFNVKNYGAKADGRTDNSEASWVVDLMAFMTAWIAACHWPGGARLLIPQGVYLLGPVIFAGPCHSSPSIVVQVQGVVKALTDPSDFPDDSWIMFRSVHGLMLSGDGTFDGQGASVWKYNDCGKSAHCQLPPTSLKFDGVNGATIRRITSIDSKAFHFSLYDCQNFNMHHLQISAPADSPNTDGIHISNSNNIIIGRSVIGTGDDCISVGKGSTKVSVAGVKCGPGHGISVGSLGKYPDEEDVVGLTVTNCTLTGTENGVRIKTWPGSQPSRAYGFTFDNILMNNVRNPIIIDQQYCPTSSCSGSAPSRVKISDVHFKNIRGTSSSKVAVNFLCSKAAPCEGIQLFNINLNYMGPRKEGPGPASTCSNVQGVHAGIQIPPSCL